MHDVVKQAGDIAVYIKYIASSIHALFDVYSNAELICTEVATVCRLQKYVCVYY